MINFAAGVISICLKAPFRRRFCSAGNLNTQYLLMARSKESFNKKELEKKKQKKKQDKLVRKEGRKNGETMSFEDMIAYVDEFGNITSTPPDPNSKTEVKEEEIIIGARNSGEIDPQDYIKRGKVSYFNNSKGYGFIKDSASGDSVFVHSSNLVDYVKENDKVIYELESGPKGLVAVNVKIDAGVKAAPAPAPQAPAESKSDAEDVSEPE
jgi:cold shock CspA family protein